MPTLNLSAGDRAALDRPVWSALTSRHQGLAEHTPLARRYPAAIAPFAAVSDHSDAAWSELAELAKDDGVAVLSQAPLERPHCLDVQFSAAIRQMVGASPVQAIEDVPVVTLDQRDVPAMLELTALTKPGPFQARTHELGRYIGIRDGGRLAAMAGERMHLNGFTEVSAVCVHPDYRGRAYAQTLVKILMKAIADRGETSILHVFDDNHGAIALYERLGFVTRAALQVTALRRPGRVVPLI